MLVWILRVLTLGRVGDVGEVRKGEDLMKVLWTLELRLYSIRPFFTRG